MMTTLITHKKLWHSLILLVLFCTGACRSQTPPGPLIVSHILEQASCTFFVWQEGLRLMLWSDIIDNGSQNGASTTGDPLFRQSGYALATDGRRVDWQLETADGRTATLHIDTQPFDLAAGTLFLITTTGGSTQIQQRAYDLAALPAMADGCLQVVANNPEVNDFVQAANKRPAQ
ncbi:MAG: hypothetical protein R3E79_59420 [Caldilineaceae bacterium]